MVLSPTSEVCLLMSKKKKKIEKEKKNAIIYATEMGIFLFFFIKKIIRIIK
jgi:hypothetical protein